MHNLTILGPQMGHFVMTEAATHIPAFQSFPVAYGGVDCIPSLCVTTLAAACRRSNPKGGYTLDEPEGSRRIFSRLSDRTSGVPDSHLQVMRCEYCIVSHLL